jgi:predicted secreted protein
MKNKISFMIVCCSLIFFAAGCSAGKTREVTKTENGSTIELMAGDTLIVSLEGNITTGYQWTMLPNLDGVMELQGEPEYAASKTKLKGAGGVYHFTFKAVKTGSTQISMKYYRSFEPDNVPPIETFNIVVVVK